MIKTEEKKLLDFIAKLQLAIKREKDYENKQRLLKILKKKIKELEALQGENDA